MLFDLSVFSIIHVKILPKVTIRLVHFTRAHLIYVLFVFLKYSPTYWQFDFFDLNGESVSCVYIPKGFAHGFYTISEGSTMVYKVSTVHAPNNDEGILWNSFGMKWPDESPVISERDAGFTELSKFNSPF